MRRVVFLIVLINSSNLLASGFDEMILWQYDMPGDSSRVINLEPSRLCRRGLEAAFFHTRPYGIQSLNWNYAVVRHGFGHIGFFGQFGYYGLNEYYARYTYSFGGAIKINESFSSAVSGNLQTEDFNHAGDYSTADLEIRFSFKYQGFTGIIGSSGINLKSAYETQNGRSMKPWVCISRKFDNGIQLYTSVKKAQNDRTRWLFGQNIDVSEAIDLHIGILNHPNVFFGRLDLSYKSVTLVLTYNSVSRLNDTVVFGIAVGS
jgi:hypothetical protein